MTPLPGAPQAWTPPDEPIQRTDLPGSGAESMTAMERDQTSELRSRLLRMILKNEQQRKSLVSSTSNVQNQLDA